MFHHMYIAPGRGRQSIGDKKFDNRKALSLCPYVASFKMISSISDFIHILMILYLSIAPGKEQKTHWGRTFDVNWKPLSLRPFCGKFEQISFNYDFIHIFKCFSRVYSPGAG